MEENGSLDNTFFFLFLITSHGKGYVTCKRNFFIIVKTISKESTNFQ